MLVMEHCYHGRFSTTETLACKMKCIQATRTSCIKSKAGAGEIVEPAETIRQHSLSCSGGFVFRFKLWVSPKKRFVVV